MSMTCILWILASFPAASDGTPSATPIALTDTLTGILEYQDIEGGAWVLRSGNTVYDLHGDRHGCKDGDRVVVRGRICKDRVCIHQLGIVFVIEEMEKVK